MKKQSISWSGDTVTIVYGNGKTFTGNCLELPESIYKPCAAARHGIAQKLGDAKSGGTAGEKFEEVQKIWASLKSGEWNRRGESGMDAEFLLSVFRVLAETAKAKNPVEQAQAWYERYQAMPQDAKDVFLSKPAVKAAINKVKADRKLAVGSGEGEGFNPFA